MKGPGLRIDVDVRRAWLCPVCGQSQRLTMDITAPRCLCVRDGAPMKLAEGQRPGRLDLRPELRSMVDRVQGGEEFPRLTPLVSAESEGGAYGGSKSRGRPPRPDRANDRRDDPPREPRPQETQDSIPPPSYLPPPVEPPAAAPQPTSAPADDDFGAGLSVGDSSAPQ